LGAGQRRGTHVSTLKIGSRDGEICFGGILWFYADLRREFKRGNLNLTFFEVVGVSSCGIIEEGGTMCVFGGIFALIEVEFGEIPCKCDWGFGLSCEWGDLWSGATTRGEVFA
jgi:hypothetical protein